MTLCNSLLNLALLDFRFNSRNLSLISRKGSLALKGSNLRIRLSIATNRSSITQTMMSICHSYCSTLCRILILNINELVIRVNDSRSSIGPRFNRRSPLKWSLYLRLYRAMLLSHSINIRSLFSLFSIIHRPILRQNHALQIKVSPILSLKRVLLFPIRICFQCLILINALFKGWVIRNHSWLLLLICLIPIVVLLV